MAAASFDLCICWYCTSENYMKICTIQFIPWSSFYIHPFNVVNPKHVIISRNDPLDSFLVNHSSNQLEDEQNFLFLLSFSVFFTVIQRRMWLRWVLDNYLIHPWDYYVRSSRTVQVCTSVIYRYTWLMVMFTAFRLTVFHHVKTSTKSIWHPGTWCLIVKVIHSGFQWWTWPKL